MSKEVIPVDFEERFEAFQIMAAETVDVFKHETSYEQRLLTTGSYLLTCALATTRVEPDRLKTVFALGLQTAGMETEKAIDLAEAFDTIEAKRIVFSLAYVRPHHEVPGVVRRKKSVTLEEPQFIRGIIARKKSTA
jgi:hypothetical protein